MQYVRSKLFDVFLVLWTVLLSLAIPVMWILDSPPRAVRKLAHIWTGGIDLGLRHIVGLNHVERGRENIPRGPFVIMANHQSPWETLILSHKFPEAAFVAKAELGRIPAVGWCLKNYPMIMIDRAAGAKAMRQLIAESKAVIGDGRPIIIFPEGTRRHLREPVEFRRGIELLYSELQVPVLPVALNSGAFWGPDRPYRRKGTITISYLPPIAPGMNREEFRKMAQSLLQAEKERLLAGLQAGTPHDAAAG